MPELSHFDSPGLGSQHPPLLPDMNLYRGELQNRSGGAKTQEESYLREICIYVYMEIHGW